MGDNGKENGNYYNGFYKGSIGFDIGLYGWLSKLWSLFGSLLKYGTEYLGYLERDPNFDNHPNEGLRFRV